MKKREEHKLLLLRPWGDLWQRWEIPNAPGGRWSCAGTSAAIEPLLGPGCCVSLPAKLVCSMAVWVPTADQGIVRESALLQLEAAGLVSPGFDAGNVEVAVLEVSGDKTLLRACAFPQDFPVPGRADYAAFRPSPLAMQLPEDAVALWREGASVVATVCVSGAPVAWETCPRPENDAAMPAFLGWLESFCIEMDAGGFLGRPRLILDYAGVFGSAGPAPAEFLGLPVVRGTEENGPPPLWPAEGAGWLPPGVWAARERERKRKNLLRAGVFAGSAAAALALAVGSYLAFLNVRAARLREEVARAEEAAAPSMRVARRWELLEPTIDPASFPLEKLLLAVSALPSEGVRLSVFEAVPEGIRIEGEARNVGLATLYFNSLQTAGGAEAYEWAMPSPALQPDNSARFAIDGRAKP